MTKGLSPTLAYPSGVEVVRPKGFEYVAPLTGTAGGRLTLSQGAATVTLWSDRTMPDLYRAVFDGTAPAVRVERGTVAIEGRSRSFINWLKRKLLWRRTPSGTITLTGIVPWRIAIQGRVAQLVADIRALALRSLLVDGRTREIDLRLPRPDDAVPIRISRRAGSVFIRRPAGVPVRLALGRAVGALTIDGIAYGPLPGDTRIASADDQHAMGRYDIAIAGSADSVTIATG